MISPLSYLKKINYVFDLKFSSYLPIIFLEQPALLDKTGVEQSIASAKTFGKDSEWDVNINTSIPL